MTEKEILKKIYTGIISKKNRTLAQYNITGVQEDLLLYIKEREDNNVIQKDICEFFDIKHTTAMYTLRELEKKNYIYRVVNKDNAKLKNIYLTPEGKAVLEQTAKLKGEVGKRLFNGFSQEERDTLKTLLEKLYDNVCEL